ncbi:MAG: hypothetical protein ACLUI3_12275 [Christensenellales bacterium]
MERELSQKPEDIDMDVVNACEALLTELSGVTRRCTPKKTGLQSAAKCAGWKAGRAACVCPKLPLLRGAGGSACLWRHGDGAGAFGQRSHQTA